MFRWEYSYSYPYIRGSRHSCAYEVHTDFFGGGVRTFQGTNSVPQSYLAVAVEGKPSHAEHLQAADPVPEPPPTWSFKRLKSS